MAVDHYENFPVASLLLPRPIRQAVRDIYRYARAADDIADEGNAAAEARLADLARFRTELRRIGAETAPIGPVDGELAPIFVPLAATVRRHQLPITPFFDLLSAFEQDVRTHRYADFDALRDYCARSADPVGRLMLHLYGAATPANFTEADAICTGLQLTNFWQDVRQDWHKGRVYLPQEDLQHFGVSEDDLAACRLTPAWRALMDFQITRARALLHSGAALPRRLPGRIGFELKLVIQGGLRILQRIEQANYDVFMNRPQLGARDWAFMAWRALT